MARSPFGNDISIVNKGEANRIAAGRDSVNADENFEPSSYFHVVKRCSPDSEEKIRLLDGEISVKDAVAFYENYINNIPCYIEQVMTISVNMVEIYRVNDDLNCLNFVTSPKYDGIPFDGVETYASGKRAQRYNLHLGSGHMIRTDDVDGFYGAFKLLTVLDETQYNDYVSLKRALEIVSNKMTQYINFKVDSVRFVYSMNENIGGWNFSEVREPVYPTWKVELYNENDGLEYICYVNALTEGCECIYLER